VDDAARFTDPETRCAPRFAEATADIARRSSAWPTFNAARISEALAFFNETFASRGARCTTFFVFAVTSRS
jgi:hypothetical protein